nr:PREDICTED: zinc finger protein 438 [Rhinolophus sinicus]XP_019587067.1 PREDICTED: zinc finger protein 438 [Rhinolophus sinicus]XP_019587068.1 PREDICTED: zinc finger protein 438 [Rhinolophus sinicus]XP_019587069.1 PREDICTED: zinc finger protein 438 [Rhinolophus sinicus]XP_019587070.1 PREDICTED: zinc finger protein 438 [Rhinolophus sinicus]XP_019587071.1 PREDICTED: zinc finger protein 438 [Rhinolophus sinicus]XP_019587072.1 PREDICTED: zinc finger protein 438 [Rhinolophus sinicus]XP_01958707
MPSGTIQSGKVLQNKSQFRTIAPKIVPRVLTSRVLSCHSPSLSDQVNPGPSISSTPLEVPTQNFALMQVAGQEGTFSLIALPHVASAQPIQKPRLPLPENLKLPIPRYQPPRNNKGSRKKPVLSSSESDCSKPLAQTRTFPSPPDHPELPPQPSPSKPVLSLDQAPASVGMAALTSAGGHGDSRPAVTNDHGDLHLPNTPVSSTPEEPSAKLGLMKISGKENFASKRTSGKPAAAASENHTEQVDLAKGTIKLPTANFGNALQLIPSVPKGKLPILPYSRMKMTEVYKSESDVNIADFSSPGLRADCNKIFSITDSFNAATRMANKVPGPQPSKRGPCDSAFCPAAKLDLNHKTKLNGGATKKKGRKLKVPDEILTFQGKRKKCKRIKNDSPETRDQKPGALKKYRSIMPKPVIVMPALAPLASPPALLQSQRPSSLGQDVLLNNSLTPKYLGCKQDNSPSPKPSSAFRNGFSGIKKPWHRCPVCNHHFQFKQHLRDHMNTHTNRRPYSCRICRKAYVRSGSLSTHMKLHHGENRLKKLVCCEFCAKVFGHVRVYFGHLKEVHRVVISTEPSPNELQPGDTPKDRDRDVTVRGMEGPVHRENKSSLEEDLLLNQADEVKLQIKCGRCQITVQSFADIKFHLLYVHGEEIQGRLQEELSPGSQAAQEERVKHASPSWKQHPERRKLLKHCPSNEEVHAFPKLKRPLYLHHQDDMEILTKHEGAQPRPSEPGPREPDGVPQGPPCPGPESGLLRSQAGFNCVLCAQTLGRKDELLLHWEQQHNCEEPPKLWRILSVLSKPGETELPSATEK